MKEMHRLLKIMSDLRDPESGCPWDIRQSFDTIAPYTIEEAYEVTDAIERKDMEQLKGELGDLLFQVVFHSQMASEKGFFDFHDVVQAINEKMIRRHPHVFAGEASGDEEELNRRWEAHKKAERNSHNNDDSDIQTSYLDGITSSLPALTWSNKLQKRASLHGFDWDDIRPVFDKIDEELAELKSEIGPADNQARIEDEMGDVFFASVNLSRHLGVDPEHALRNANRKFISRFESVEKLLDEDEKIMEDCSVEMLERYWQKAKQVTSED